MVDTFVYSPVYCPKCGAMTSGIGTVNEIDPITFAAVIWCDVCKYDVRKLAETAIFSQLGVIRKWKAGRSTPDNP